MRNKLEKVLLIVVLLLGIVIVNSINNKVYANDGELEKPIENEVESQTENEVELANTETSIKAENEKANKTKIELKNLKIKVNNKDCRKYTGEPITISVKIYDGKKKLKLNRDYTLTFKKNINPGKATVKIKGIGNYKGTVTDYFIIVPNKPKITTVTFNSKFTRANITWEKDSKAMGYKIYMSTTKDGEYTKIKTITDKNVTSYTKGGLNPDNIYYFKMKAFTIVDGRKYARKQFSNPKSNTGLVSTVTLTASGSTANRNYNLQKACNAINGKILRPGETFNWFETVGPASASRGYKLATIFQGTKHVLGAGGGVCQVSSTVYQASRNAGLQIVERHIHSQPVSYTTLGNDATVYYGVHNLRIRNNKGYTIKLVMSASGASTNCKIYRVLD